MSSSHQNPAPHGMEVDREYIQTWRTIADLRMPLKTSWAVLQGSGD